MKENNALEGILICHVDDVGGTNKFESEIISKLKQSCKFGTEDPEVFTCIATESSQHAGFTITMSQKNYVNSISGISFSKQRTRQSNDKLNET